MSYVLVLCLTIDVVVVVVRVVLPPPPPALSRGACTPPFISKGQGYKEGNQVGYSMIPIRSLSLLAYFTYISIDIAIYTLVSTPWSSRIL
jgi:hypothetical protein